MGAELPARHLDASAFGPAELSGGTSGVAHGRRLWLASCGPAHRAGRALHVHRYHAHEQQDLVARPRSRFRRDAPAARAVWTYPYGSHGVEHSGHRALHTTVTWNVIREDA